MSLLRAQLHFRAQSAQVRRALSPRVLGAAKGWLARAVHTENGQEKGQQERTVLLYDNKGKGALVTRLIGVAGVMSTTYWGVYMYQLTHPEVSMPVFEGLPQNIVMGGFGLFFSGILGFMITMYSKRMVAYFAISEDRRQLFYKTYTVFGSPTPMKRAPVIDIKGDKHKDKSYTFANIKGQRLVFDHHGNFPNPELMKELLEGNVRATPAVHQRGRK